LISVAVGPFALSVDRLVIVSAFLFALLVGWLLGRRRGISVEPTLTGMMLLGVLGARVVFVLLYLEDYLIQPLSMLDIRDGGFHFAAGVTSAALFGIWRAWRRPALRSNLAIAVVTGTTIWTIATLGIQQMDESRPPLPPIVLETLSGEQINLHTLNDMPMVINLWATWCLPCRREMPVLEAAQQREPGIRFVFINQGETSQQIRDYLDDEDLGLANVLLDRASVTTRLLNTRGLPTTYFFDANGEMLDAHVGELSRASLNQKLRQLRRPPG
jgi:thiol-disulfide isomerase/thioredoxin